MAREEAGRIIAIWLVSSKGEKGQRGYIEGWFDEEDVEAFHMAIEALKKGKWLEVDSFESEKHSVTDMRCSLCGKYASIVLPHGNKYIYDFCPNCGADMRGWKCSQKVVRMNG